MEKLTCSKICMELIDINLKTMITFREEKRWLGWEGEASGIFINFICLYENLKEMRKVQEYLWAQKIHNEELEMKTWLDLGEI